MTTIQGFETSELDFLPTSDRADPVPAMRADHLERAGRRVIVVDDDAPGVHLLRNVGLVTAWEPADIAWLLDQPGPAGVVLTNSRSLPAAAAAKVNEQVGRRLRAAADRVGLQLDVVSRGDSTLRGHFPVEADALDRGLGGMANGTILMPFYAERNCITVNGVHYVGDGRWYTPVAETEFATTGPFRFTQSSLAEWVEEESGGAIPATSLVVIDIATIRTGGVGAVESILLDSGRGRFYAIDAIDERDVDIVVAAIRRTIDAGLQWMYRASPGLVRSLAGQVPGAAIEPPPIVSTQGGLVVVGSPHPMASRQLTRLVQSPWVESVEADVVALADPVGANGEVRRLIDVIDRAVRAGRIAVLSTARRAFADRSGESSAAIGDDIVAGLCRVVAALDEPPAYLVASGGSTAHRLAVEALGARRVRVLGPLGPSMPIWQLGEETAYPGLPYVALPGAAGEEHTLADVVARFEQARR